MTKEQKEFIAYLDDNYIAYEINLGVINIKGRIDEFSYNFFGRHIKIHDITLIPSGVIFTNKGNVCIYIDSINGVSDDVVFDNKGRVCFYTIDFLSYNGI